MRISCVICVRKVRQQRWSFVVDCFAADLNSLTISWWRVAFAIRNEARFELYSRLKTDPKHVVLKWTIFKNTLLYLIEILNCKASESEEFAYLKKKKKCFRPGSNRRPFACEANVITATLRKLNVYKKVFKRPYLFVFKFFLFISSPAYLATQHKGFEQHT